MNLAAFREFKITRHRLQSPEPFVRWPSPPPTDAGPTTRENYTLRTQHLVLLRALRKSERLPHPGEDIDESTWVDLVERIRNADLRRFHVLIKRGCELHEIVSLYNRINSSGVPVRKEERAYAAMVSLDPRTPDWLRDCFKAAHPHHADTGREAVLKRERERFYGFPLFISAYSQTVGFHRNLKGDLDLLARDNPDTSWVQDGGDRAAMRSDSLHCISQTAQVLRTKLRCDDLRFLPSAEPLRLAFSVLLKYPKADDWTLARVLLLGQLNRITGHTRPNRIEQAILESNRLAEAMAAFPTVPAMLGDQQAFGKRLLRVQSMNDPWLSLLYWYQRSRRSRDYVATDGRFLPLNRRVAATKEHIVPFSLLYRHYGVDPRGHSASHVVNAIGNLTMVSSDMNYGHGADPVPLRDVDKRQLLAHHLDDPEVLQRYAAVIAAIEDGAPSGRIRTRYERFVRVRTQHLAGGMYAWLVRITQKHPENSDLEPRARRINPSPPDLLRQQSGIPKAFKSEALAIGVRSDGTFWLLHRTPGRYTRADKIRLDHRCTALHVGLRIPAVDTLTGRLDTILIARWRDSLEIVYGIHPGRTSAHHALQAISEFTKA